jgi:hypothetical protein
VYACELRVSTGLYIKRACLSRVVCSSFLSHATSCLHYESTACQSLHSDRSLSGRLFSFLSAVSFCPLSSVLCLFSVLGPHHRPRTPPVPPVPPVPPGRRVLLRCSAFRSCRQASQFLFPTTPRLRSLASASLTRLPARSIVCRGSVCGVRYSRSVRFLSPAFARLTSLSPRHLSKWSHVLVPATLV